MTNCILCHTPASVLFGSEKFEPYVGDLAIATTAAKMFSNAEKHVAKGGMSAESAKEEMMQHSDMAEKEKRQQVWCRFSVKNFSRGIRAAYSPFFLLCFSVVSRDEVAYSGDAPCA